MIRSVIRYVADKATRRPTWLEQDGSRLIEVYGYSPLQNLIYGAIAAGLILSPIAMFLVSNP